MKSLKQYITESVKLYDYTIKIAGEVDKNFLDLFAHNLKEKFDAVDISRPVSTPIQKDPYGFPDLRNESVTIIKANFRYPATEPMIQQIAQLLGYNVNMVRAIQTNYNDSINSEAEGYANEASHSPLLDHEQLEEQPGAKEAAKAYGDSYRTSIKDQMKGNEIQMQYATKETPDAFDPFKAIPQDPRGGDSPMSKITRPAKPKTGAAFNK
jgi:hypothetical protein